MKKALICFEPYDNGTLVNIAAIDLSVDPPMSSAEEFIKSASFSESLKIDQKSANSSSVIETLNDFMVKYCCCEAWLYKTGVWKKLDI